MRPEEGKIFLDNQAELDIALSAVRYARPLRGQALRELYMLEGTRPPYVVEDFTALRVVDGLKRIALRNIRTALVSPEKAEEILVEELDVSLYAHRL
jgi:hypothetical protein